MTQEEFVHQMKRFDSVFGQKSYPWERLELIKRHVIDLPPYNFSRIVDHLLSTMRQAPLPKDFKEAAYAERKQMEDLRSVPDIMKPDYKGDKTLQKVLARDYPGCKTLWEAVEVEKVKIRISKLEAQNDG